MIVLSDGRHVYIHKFESNESMLSRLFFFYLKIVFCGGGLEIILNQEVSTHIFRSKWNVFNKIHYCLFKYTYAMLVITGYQPKYPLSQD